MAYYESPGRGVSEATFIELLSSITEERPLIWAHSNMASAKATADTFYSIKKRYINRHKWLWKITCTKVGARVTFRIDTTQSLKEGDLNE